MGSRSIFKSGRRYMTKWYKISRKDHNRLFPTRKLNWRTKYKYEYVNNTLEQDCLYLYKHPTLLLVLLATLVSPILCIVYGYVNVVPYIRELWSGDGVDVDFVSGVTKTYRDFMTIAKEIKN